MKTTKGSKQMPHYASLLLVILTLCLVAMIISLQAFAEAVPAPGNPGTSSSPGLKETATAKKAATANVVKTVFDNGLTLLVKPNPANDVVAVTLFVKMGPTYELKEQFGISALMQRVLTRGTATRSARDIAYQTESVGASISAGAGYDYGTVSLMTTRFELDKAMAVFLDVIQNPSFPEDEVGKEKNMTLQQIASLEDQPFNVALLAFLKEFYGDHPYGTLSIGTNDAVASLSREDLLAWYKKVYVPNNMVITVVGNVDPVAQARIFGDTLGKLPKGEIPKPAPSEFPPRESDTTSYKQKPTQALFMVLGYPAPDMLSEDAPAMDVLNAILGGGMSSRLFVELRDKKGLAYMVTSAYQKQLGPSSLLALMATHPANYAAARDGIVAEFRRLAEEDVPLPELDSAKRFVKGTYLMSHETNADQGWLLGTYELLGLGYDYDDRYPELVEKVTQADIKRVAGKYFGHYALGALSPIPLEPAAKPPAAAGQAPEARGEGGQ